MPHHYDAIVIGAGPAGSIAAAEIAQEGFSVLLLEKHQQPGKPLCCAEAVSKAALARLVEIKQEWISACIDKIKVVAPNGEDVTIHHPGAGLVLERPDFDFDLAQAAIKAGCELQCNAIGLELIRDGGLFRFLKVLHCDGSNEEISARIFIAADGVESKIARMAGLNNLIIDEDNSAFIQYRLTEIDIDPVAVEFYVGNEVAPGNYLWVFPKSANSANVGVGVGTKKHKGGDSATFLDRFIEAHFRNAKIEATYCGSVPAYQGKNMFRLDNMLVAGDAARTLDSLSGAGIINAMLSGKYAGIAAVQYLSGKINNLTEIEQYYPGEFLKNKEEELLLYARLRKVYRRLSDKDFIDIIEALEDYFNHHDSSGVSAGKLLAGIIRTRPRLMRLIRHLI